MSWTEYVSIYSTVVTWFIAIGIGAIASALTHGASETHNEFAISFGLAFLLVGLLYGARAPEEKRGGKNKMTPKNEDQKLIHVHREHGIELKETKPGVFAVYFTRGTMVERPQINHLDPIEGFEQALNAAKKRIDSFIGHTAARLDDYSVVVRELNNSWGYSLYSRQMSILKNDSGFATSEEAKEAGIKAAQEKNEKDERERKENWEIKRFRVSTTVGNSDEVFGDFFDTLEEARKNIETCKDDSRTSDCVLVDTQTKTYELVMGSMDKFKQRFDDEEFSSGTIE